MNFAEQFSKKLYNPRDIEGVANTELFEIVDVIYNALLQEKEFVAIEPFGSSVKGYSTAESDVDIRLYFEVTAVPEDLDTDEFVLRYSENHQRTEELKQKAIDALKQLDFDMRTIHISVFTLDKAKNSNRIKRGLGDENDPEIVAGLFKIVKGARIAEFRDPVIEQLQALSEDDRMRQIDAMAAALSEVELKSFRKIDDRTNESLAYEDLLNKRTALWKGRILSFFE